MGNLSHKLLPQGVDPDLWPRRDDVPFLYGVTMAAVRGLQANKRLQGYQDSMGVIRFSPHDLERWIGPMRRDVKNYGRAERPPEIGETPAADVTTESALEMLLRETAALFKDERHARLELQKQVHEERKDVLKLVLDPAAAMQTALRDTMRDLREQLNGLQKVEMEMRQAHQDLLDARATRDLELLTTTKREERRDKALVQLQPHFIGLMKKFGVDVAGGEAAQQLAAISEFVEGLDAEVLRIILADENLSAAQRAALLRMRPDLAAGSPQPNGATQ